MKRAILNWEHYYNLWRNVVDDQFLYMLYKICSLGIFLYWPVSNYILKHILIDTQESEILCKSYLRCSPEVCDLCKSYLRYSPEVCDLCNFYFFNSYSRLFKTKDWFWEEKFSNISVRSSTFNTQFIIKIMKTNLYFIVQQLCSCYYFICVKFQYFLAKTLLIKKK